MSWVPFVYPTKTRRGRISIHSGSECAACEVRSLRLELAVKSGSPLACQPLGVCRGLTSRIRQCSVATEPIVRPWHIVALKGSVYMLRSHGPMRKARRRDQLPPLHSSCKVVGENHMRETLSLTCLPCHCLREFIGMAMIPLQFANL